ncbi:pseudouridine synthase [Parahaliea mediterranea]|uniref:tRNA pseudouridine synthase C n=1 Tax=Parahaliea mediterranea TaxID=651086 RepID=A0A939DHS0_9GAMM|nr:pseudouridine synthase [Parahaliea mediterranea]MBN7798355.1 pseudouridylate synthase [Parahaliea mediterranea]
MTNRDRDETLPVIHHDADLIAVNKPSGLLVHRSPIDRRETRFALQIVRNQAGRRVYPVHRLDKPTSGVLLFTFTPELAAAVAAQFQQRAVAKRYVAVVRGYCPESGAIDHPIRDDPDPLAGLDRGPPREAFTHFRRLATVDIPHAVDRYPTARYSLVELRPETGRKHQLRRHMKHIGHPIIGDAKHGKGVHNRFFREQYGAGRLLLACTELALRHPATGAPLQLRATLDDDFARLSSAFGWRDALATAMPWALALSNHR